MKTALVTCLVFCLFAADVNGQTTTEDRDSLEGITQVRVMVWSMAYDQRDYEKDQYLQDLVELNLRKYGIRVPVTVKQREGVGLLQIASYERHDGTWSTELRVAQYVQLINRNIATKKHTPHLCDTYMQKAFTDTKQEGVEEVLTRFLNNYLSVNEKYRSTQHFQPSPTSASNQLSPLPSSSRTTELRELMQVNGIGGQ